MSGSSSYHLAAVSDAVRVWETVAAPLNSKVEPPAPRSPVFTLKGATQPIQTVWNGAFDTLATLYSSHISMHKKDGQILQETISMSNRGSGTSTDTPRTVSFGFRNSRFLYYAGSGKVVNVWDRQEGKLETQLIGHKSTIQTLALSTDDQRCASGSTKGDLIIHSLKHGTKSVLKSPLKQGINQVQFYPFKKSVVMAGGDEGSLVFWDIHSKLDPTLTKRDIHLGPITGLAFAPCNKHLYCTVGLDQVLRFHDVNQSNQNILHSFTSTEPLTSVTINEDHSVAVGTSKGGVVLYDVRWKGPVFTIPPQSNVAVSCLVFQPPKWAIDAASKEKISFPSLKKVDPVELPTVEAIPKVSLEVESPLVKPSDGGDRAMMDMFSPVNKKKISKFKEPENLRKATLFKSMLAAKIEEAKEEWQVSNIEPQTFEDEKPVLSQAEELMLPSIPDSQPKNGPKMAENNMETPRAQKYVHDEPSKELKDTTDLERSETLQSDEITLKEPMRRISGLVTTSETTKPTILQKTPGFPLLQRTNNQTSFQYNVLENIIQDSLADFREQTRADIQNMHIELLRQFQIQKMELESLFERHLPNLLEELQRLREENAQLKRQN